MNNTFLNRIKNNLPQSFCALVIIGILIGAIIVAKKNPTDYIADETECKNFTEQFYTEDGTGIDKLPYFPGTGAGTTTTIVSELPDDIEDNQVVLLRPDQLDMKVYVDGQLRIQYSTLAVRVRGKVSPRRYIFMPVNSSDAGKELRVELFTTIDNAGNFNVLTYGDKYDVLSNLSSGSIADILIAGVMLIICVISLIGGIIISIGVGTFAEITYLAILGIMASVWILCNAEISQLYFNNMTLAMTIDYLMIMLLPFPFLFFMNKVQNKRFNLIYSIFEYLVMAESSICLILFMLDVVDLSQMFLVLAAAFGGSLIMILVTIVIDVFFNKNYSYLIVTIGIFAGILATIFQIALFLAGAFSFGGKSVAIALLIILFTAIIDTYKKVKKAEQEKQMAIAQGKAESSFLANMSHEIRTPINAVLGLNEMILRESKEQQTLEYAKNIDNSGKMLLSIVNDILDFSKIRSGKMKIIEDKYSVDSLVSGVRDMVSKKADEKKLDFTVSVDENIPNFLSGDEIRIKQVIVNVLNNAVKYTDKGSVTFKVSGTPCENDFIKMCFEISDTGRGIKEEDIDNLFDAFARVDEKNNRTIEGTGLGLALVQNFVASMNGNISVDSIYGQGSTFTIEIPQKILESTTIADIRRKDVVKQEQKEEALFTAPDARVLVVDDVKVNLTVVKGLLKRTKVGVVTASSGEECIKILSENTFDVVLLDHLMPQMDGVETLAKIKQEKIAEGTPVIALTANAISGAREEYLSYGFDDYLTKPVKGDELEKMLAKYIPESKIEAG